MISVSEALHRVLEACPVLGTVSVPLDHSIGRVLREDIIATEDAPPFDRVMMDGYAVRTRDLGGTDVLSLIG